MYRVARLPWWLGILYATLGLALVLWTRRSVDESADALARATAELLGTQLSQGVAAIAIDGVDDLSSLGSRFELYSAVAGLALRVDLVESVEVLDRDGRVAAADPVGTIGEQRPEPASVFGTDTRALLTQLPSRGFQRGSYLVELPLLREDELVGGLRLVLDNQPFDDLYADARRRLGVFAVAMIGILVLVSFLLHVQVRRYRERVQRAFEAALAGQQVDPELAQDPFAPVMQTASRLGLELVDARERSGELERGLGRLGELLEVGIVVIDRVGGLRFASATARSLVGEVHFDGLVADLKQRLFAGETNLTAVVGQREIAVHADRVGDDDFVVLLRRAESARSLETDLRMSAQLRSMMGLYRGAAHDLRAPLNALVLNLELLRRSLAPGREDSEGLRESQRNWVEVVSGELGRLRRSLETLLDHAAPPSPSTSAIDVAALLGDIELLVGPMAREQNISVQLVLPAERPKVFGYADRLKQAVLNLVINACEAMPEGGQLELAVRIEDGRVVISVTDSGSGIPEAVRDQLFRMHFTTKSSGTGVGLYTARAVAAGLGGTLRLVSTGPTGTCFELEVPAA